MIHLINMCNKFVALNKLIAKLADPYMTISEEDLECLEFAEFQHIPVREDLFWALQDLADQAEDLMMKTPGSVWEKFEKKRKIRKDLRDLEKRIKRA
ncbi:hypothetical protein LCGC14_0318710 [marine sediment metagenome]|uniref:Uncharacterized protein n=1 Tax=marine sediment metagenome TaxID=412755 RepID=A0A0F9U2Q4_9ZZZZ